MDTSTARLVTDKAAALIQLASTFQSRYGKNYRMKPGSPKDAWQLQQAIFDQQTTLARLLNPYALENPLRRVPEWWKSQDVMDDGIATQIALEALHLIACCASFDASRIGEPSPVILCSQRVIAGILHPSAVLVAQSEQPQVQIAS